MRTMVAEPGTALRRETAAAAKRSGVVRWLGALARWWWAAWLTAPRRLGADDVQKFVSQR